MAEHAKAASAADKPKEEDGVKSGHGFWGKVADEVASDTSEFLANFIYNSLSEEKRSQLRRQGKLLLTARALRFIPGLPHAGEEFIQGFVSNFHRLATSEHHPAGHSDAPPTEARRINRAVQVALAVMELDEDTYNDFEEWLNAEDSRRQAFLRAVEGLNDDQIRKLASQPAPELERLVRPFREAPPVTDHETIEDVVEKAVRNWNRADAAVAWNLRTATRWVNRVGNQAKANHYGIEPPLYTRLGLFLIVTLVVVVIGVMLGIVAELSS